MTTATRHFERHMEEVASSKAVADRRNKVGKVLQDLQESEREDSLAERVEEELFGDLPQTDEQEFMHALGGGVSKGPPRGGWPVFHPVTGRRLADPHGFTSSSPH